MQRRTADLRRKHNASGGPKLPSVTSAKLLSVNYGTLYPALLKLEQEGYISSEWGVSDNNRKAKYYQLTRAGRKQIEKETHEWEQTTAILARFLNRKEGLA